MRLSLKMKLVLSSLSLIFLTIVVLSWFSYQSMKDQAWSAIRSESHNTAAAYSKGIGDWFGARQQAVQALKEAIELKPNLDIVSHLKQTLVAGDFGLSYYGTREGVMHRHDPSLNKAGYDPRTRGWYKEAYAARQPITTKPYVSHTMQTLVVTLADPVFQQGEIVGVAASNLAMGELVKDILNINVPGKGYAMLLDTRDNVVVAHPNAKMQLKPLTDIGADFAADKLQRVMAGDNFFFSQVGGVEKAVVVAAVPNTSWAIALVMDQDTLEAPMRDMLIKQALIGLVILLFVSVFVAWLVTHQLRELNTVSDALADIANGEGDLTVRIDVQTDDDIGKLADNFNQFVSRQHVMATKLRDITHHLNEAAANTADSAFARSESIRRQQDEITMVARPWLKWLVPRKRLRIMLKIRLKALKRQWACLKMVMFRLGKAKLLLVT